MRLAEVIGHAPAVARLVRAAAEDRVPNAFLFLGPEGIGKRLLADAFTARLLCAAPVADDACGGCPQCTRVAAGTHPDGRVVAREEDRRDIRIEQVRELCRWLALQPLMAGRKVTIVDGAHELNEHGQNALLRTLEEPPGGAVILLLATSAALLLPTVRSRCQVVRLHPLSRDEVARVLGACGVPAERVALLAALAEGAPGRALRLEGEEGLEARRDVLAVLPELAAARADELSGLAQELARRPPEAALAAAVGFYRDLLQLALGEALALRTVDAEPVVRGAAGRLPAVARLRQLATVCDTIEALGRNANRVLALETMLLSLRAIERGPSVLPDDRAWTSRA